MARINENYIWPLFGIAIFSVLIAFYVDDRRKMLSETEPVQEAQASTKEEPNTKSSSHQSPTQKAENLKSTNTSYNKKNSSTKTKHSSTADNSGFSGTIEEYLTKYSDNKKTADTPTKESKSTSDTKSPHDAPVNTAATNANEDSSSRSMDDYLAESSQTNKEDSQPSAKEHEAFSGSIDEYMASFSEQTNVQSITKKNSSSAKTADNQSAQPSKKHAQYKNKHKKETLTKENYSGSIDGYLSKYDESTKKQLNKAKNKSLRKHKPFGEHSGFHGSYDEYARLYN